MDAAERELFAASLAQVTSTRRGAALDAALDELGWTDALEVDLRAAVSLLFEQQGAAGATSSALGRLLAASLGLTVEAGSALVLPALGSADVPGVLDEACVPSPEVTVRGVGLEDVRRSEHAVVVISRDGSCHTTSVEVAALDPRDVDGIDPELGLVELHATLGSSGPWQPVAGDWDAAVAVARLAIGHELVGAMRSMLDLAREHALERIQFGAPIASFQAVRHKLAETLVAIEAAEAALDGAWVDGSPFTALVAKAVAGNSARTVRKHCQQVLAGIGFTTEHDLHRFVRRTMVLDALLGDARALTQQIGAELLAAGRLPQILPL